MHIFDDSGDRIDLHGLTIFSQSSILHSSFVSNISFSFQDNSHFVKIVVALYPFKAIEAGDLSLEKVRIVIFLNYFMIYRTSDCLQ